MEKSKVYVLFSNTREETDYHILCATTDLQDVIEVCEESMLIADYEIEYNNDLTPDIIESKNYIDFRYDDDGVRCVLNSYEVEVPEDSLMYGVIANGDERCHWDAEMIGLYPTREAAVNVIINEISKREYEPDDIEQYREQLNSNDSITDLDFTYWDIIKMKVTR